MTSSEWIGLEIICYYCIYSTPRWAGSISPGGSVWISSAIVQYSIQLSKFCLRNVTLLCYSTCICCVTSLYFVSSAPYLPSDSWNGEIAVLKFQASAPFNCFTQEDIFFSIAADENIYDLGPFQFQFWRKYCGILVQYGFISYGVADKRRNKLFNQNKINPHGFLQAVYCSPKSLFAVVCSF